MGVVGRGVGGPWGGGGCGVRGVSSEGAVWRAALWGVWGGGVEWGACTAVIADWHGLRRELVNSAGLGPTTPTVPNTQTDSKLAL